MLTVTGDSVELSDGVLVISGFMIPVAEDFEVILLEASELAAVEERDDDKEGVLPGVMGVVVGTAVIVMDCSVAEITIVASVRDDELLSLADGLVVLEETDRLVSISLDDELVFAAVVVD